MKKHLLLAVLALTLAGGKAVAQEQSAATTQQTMPDTTNLDAMFEYIKTLPPSQEQLQQYQWLINKVQAAQPVDKDLLARVLCNTALLLQAGGMQEESLACFDDALKVTQQMLDEGVVRAKYLDAAIRINLTNALAPNDPDRLKKRTHACDVAVSELDEFLKNDKATGDDKDDALIARAFALVMAACDYHNMKQYDKSLLRGERGMKLWDALEDAQKENLLYIRYMVTAIICQSAEKRGLETKFHTLAKDLESFLGNVSEQLQAGKIQVDEQTRRTLAGLCCMHLTSYSDLRDLERAKEMAALSLTFDEKYASIANYELCKAYIHNGKIDEARQLHAQLLTDKEFVDQYLKDGDTVKDDLDRLAKSGDKLSSDDELADLKSSIGSSIDRMSAGGGSIRIQGFNSGMLAERQMTGGHISLPIDRTRSTGVGVSFRIGK